MPLYEYKSDAKGCDQCTAGFEVLQSIKESAIEKCPKCGAAVRRVFSSFAMVKSTRNMLGSKNLDRLGFTQYKKAGDGHYEKTAGGGPNVISRDP